jgi:protocatechuate 3,4-dioxygenase beta subunit
MKSKKKVQPGAMKRRWFVLGAPSVILGSVLAGPVRALSVTPRQSEGPFYPRVLPEDSDADLTSFKGQRVSGEVIEIVGRLLATSGEPIARGEVEIWHCDPNGVYAHVGQETVPHFQGFGAVRTDESGGYRFRTTLPGIYPGRARHVHIKARGQRGLFLTTQMYFPGEADNGQDFLLMRASDPLALIAQKEPGPPPKFRFDIVLA